MSLEDVELELVDSSEKVASFIQWLGNRRSVLAFDTETGGLDPEKCALRLVQFGDHSHGWAIPWERWGGVALEAFQRYDGEFVGHNAKFDVRFIELHGGVRLPRERIHDTRIMCHLLDPASSTALKPNAARLVDAKSAYASRALDEAMAAQKWTWATVPIEFPMYWGYGATDTVLTAYLYDVLRPQVANRGLDTVYELERAVSWILADMEARGARVDLDYTRAKSEELERFINSTAEWCLSEHSVAAGSHQQVANRLAELGANLTKRTNSGAFALDEEVLQSIIGGALEDVDGSSFDGAQRLAYQVYARRKSEKVKSTYLDSMLGFADANGFVHPQMNQLGARTGRMSMERPALQTLPRGRIVRDAFIPREGHKLLSADFDGIEMRLLAHFSGDAGLIEAIHSGDIHLNTAQRVYQDPTIDKKDPRRQTAKNVGFAKIYGAGPEKIAATAGISVDEAKAFLTAYDTTFPGVRNFQNQVAKVAQQRRSDEGVAYVRTPIGRYQPSEDRDYALVNFLIQGTAADVFKEALVRLDEAGLGDCLLLPVHDEIIVDVATEDVDEAVHTLSTVMLDERWAVPLTVGVDGPLDRWGDKYGG